MLKVIILITLSHLLVVSADSRFKHIVRDDSLMINVVSQESYALTGPEIRQLNWAGVSFDGNKATIVTQDCKVLQEDASEMSQDERAQLETVEQRLQLPRQHERFVNDGQYWVKHGETSNNFFGQDGYNINTNIDTFGSGARRIQKMGDNHIVISDSNGGLPDGISRIFIDDDLVSFLYSNGSIRMQPNECLDAGKQQLVENTKRETDGKPFKTNWTDWTFQGDPGTNLADQNKDLNAEHEQRMEALREQLKRDQQMRQLQLQQYIIRQQQLHTQQLLQQQQQYYGYGNNMYGQQQQQPQQQYYYYCGNCHP